MVAIKIVFFVFSFSCEASPTDPKTNIHYLKSIQILDEVDVFVFLAELQDIKVYPELAKYATIKAALKQLDRRGKTHTVKLTIDDELREVYIDEYENIVFRKTHFLDQVPTSSIHSSSKQSGVFQ